MKKNNKLVRAVTEQDKPVHSFFPIVGIGSSAGGLEAMEQFFSNVPDRSGMAFIVIQHFDPNYKGMLRELLQRLTKMNVQVTCDKMKIERENIYIIPPNKNISILKNVLYLFDPPDERGTKLPIDFFFRSLGNDRKEKSIGIILSGMGSDGSNGIRAIKEAGGMVLIQDPSFAKYDSMPRTAAAAVVPDVISPASELPLKLINILHHTPVLAPKDEEKNDSFLIDKIIILLRMHTGNDFSQYKKNTIYRRVERRMGIHKINNLAAYVGYLQANSSEVDILFNELLIGVTCFFRDQNVWDTLMKEVFPGVIAKLPDRSNFRVWVPGCATGEEAYSIAIAFKEALETVKVSKDIRFSIFATDLDPGAIEKARKGLFPANISADISPQLLKKYFIKCDERFRVSGDIREMVIFAIQNVLKDPPFTKIDLISCRNLMIYLESEVQKKLLSLFNYSLNPNGILLLGSSETPGQSNPDFSIINSKQRIFQKTGEFRTNEITGITDSGPTFQIHDMKNNHQQKNDENFQSLTEQVIMQYFSPPGVLAKPDGEILYLSGNTEKFLAPPAGKANLNLFLMAREPLRSMLPASFSRAMLDFQKLVLKDVKMEVNGTKLLTDVTIQQLEKPFALKGKIMVVFSESEVPINRVTEKSSVTRKNSAQITDLENKLQKAEDELQSAIEEMQTSQEELRSANEELQSTNEELQSTNEELMTSKEEMQSLNEELQTVNSELQSKIEDLAKVNNDMTNLLNSIDIATLFLDKELRIRQFTYPATKIFKLIPTDIGRLFTDQVTDLNYPGMYTDATEVLRTLVFIEKQVSTKDGRWFSIRMMPYRTIEDKIDGLVITFIDITDKKHYEELLIIALNQFDELLHDLPTIVVRLTKGDERIIGLNPYAEKILKSGRDKAVGSNFYDYFIIEEDVKSIRNSIKNLNNGKVEFESGLKKEPGLKIRWSARKIKERDGADIITLIGEIVR